MADDKKPVAPEKDAFVEFVWLLLALFVFLYFLNKLILLVIDIASGKVESKGFIGFLVSIYFWITTSVLLKVIIILLSLIFIAGIIYLYRKISELYSIERKLLYPEVPVESGSETNLSWQRVEALRDSLNENDWRLSIIEADIILDGLLDKLSLPGETMGDKLKAVEKSDFLNIDNAWEAHKTRNQIAHDGPAFLLNQHETKRVIGLYQSVFEEFKII